MARSSAVPSDGGVSGANGLDHLFGDTGLAGEVGMSPELELRPPMAAGEHDDEFAKRRAEGRTEAAVRADLLRGLTETGAAKPGLEGAAHTAARAGDDGVGDAFLFGIEGGEVERGKAWHMASSGGEG